MQLAEDVISHIILQNPMPERASLIFGLPAPTRLLITNAKVLNSEGKEVAKPHFLHGDAIPVDGFVMITEERQWLWEVDGRMMFLPSIVWRYSIWAFYVSTIHIMGEDISAFQGGVTFRYFNRQGGHSTEMGSQAMG